MTGALQPSGQAGDGHAPSGADYVAGQRGVQVCHAHLKPQKRRAYHFAVQIDANASAAPVPRANMLTQLERRLRACVQGLRRDHFAGSGGMSDIDLW